MTATPAEIAAHERRRAARRARGRHVLDQTDARLVASGHRPGCESAFIGEDCNCFASPSGEVA
jgi:hypothetical protein